MYDIFLFSMHTKQFKLSMYQCFNYMAYNKAMFYLTFITMY